METLTGEINKNMRYWEFRKNKRAPYLKGSNVNLGNLWVTYKTNKRHYKTIEEFARDGSYDIEVIKEGFEWCRKHNNEVTLDCEDERRRGGYKY